MKTVRIRSGPGIKRPISAIAYDPPDDSTDKRDVCPTLKFFQEAKGAYPDSWTDLFAVIDETARNGPPDNKQKFNYLGDGIYEFKSWKLRLYCFFDDDSLIICLFGVFKHTQRADPDTVEAAKKKKTEYLELKKRGKITHA